MRRIPIFNIGLFLFILSSCNHDISEKTLTKVESLKIAVDDFNKDPLTKKSIDLSKVSGILIIPNAGCDGCISTAETFVLDNYEKYEKLLVVFTRVSSLKSLKIRSNNRVLSSSLTIVDQKNQFSRDSLNSAYPLVAFIKDSNIMSIEEQSPFNTELLSKLVDHLDH